jgi:hypothetical protein
VTNWANIRYTTPKACIELVKSHMECSISVTVAKKVIILAYFLSGAHEGNNIHSYETETFFGYILCGE